MPPLKKAAKKAAKKTIETPPVHPPCGDLRRAYEHMNRVEILQKFLKPSDAKVVTALATLARQQLESDCNRKAADLLRGSEHLSFAALADEDSRKVQLSAELVQSITKHFKELARRAEKHWKDGKEEPAVLTVIYKSSLKDATVALKHGAYHRALELARAAEALADVKRHGSHKPQRGKKAPKSPAL